MNVLLTAVNAAIKAGEAILKVYEGDFTVEVKTDDSPLTQADLASNTVINSFLDKTAIPIISEENKAVAFEERSKWSTCWIVDPLDGTKEFIKRNGEFTVNIALVHNGLVQLGVIYVPVSNTLYFADVAAKAAYAITTNQVFATEDDLLQQAKLLTPAESLQSIRVVASRSHLSKETEAFIKDLKINHPDKTIEIVSKGSSLKFCLVAEGLADIYPRFAPTMEWDTAAGQAICEAVGKQVIDVVTQKPMLYNREQQLNNFFVVS